LVANWDHRLRVKPVSLSWQNASGTMVSVLSIILEKAILLTDYEKLSRRGQYVDLVIEGKRSDLLG
jgi:hypothetical protein